MHPLASPQSEADTSGTAESLPGPDRQAHGTLGWGAPLLVLGGGALLGMVLLARSGEPEFAIRALLTTLARLASVSWMVLAYLASSLGLGLALLRVVGLRRERGASLTLAWGVGFSLQVFLTLTLGWGGAGAGGLGVLGTQVGAWLALLPGLAGLAWSWRSLRSAGQGHWLLCLLTGGMRSHALLALGVGAGLAGFLFAGSMSTPGVLWRSEFGGYDSLSYHLQLPQEWIAGGGIATLPHNVYSALPSGLEGAFMHVAQLGGPERGMGLLDGGGAGLYASQLLHAMTTILSALALASLGRRMLLAWGVPEAHAGMAGCVAGVVCLSVPWTIVVGSLSYNEMGVVFLFACAGQAALLARGKSGAGAGAGLVGALAAVLVGGATLAKPTALTFVGLPIALALGCCVPARHWWRVLALGVPVGLVMIAPWLARNGMATGNPIFPFGGALSAHADGSMGRGEHVWTSEQVARFGRAHRFDGGVVDRLGLMVLPDAQDPVAPSHRGVLHPQWGPWLVLGLLVGLVAGMVAGVALLARHDEQRTRETIWKLAGVLGACVLLQVLVWLFTTHIQSRFLMPLLVPVSLLMGVVVAWIATRVSAGRVFVLALALPLIVLVAWPTRMGTTNVGLLLGTELWRATSVHSGSGEQATTPEQFVNDSLPAGSVVLLVGDATPLYFVPGRVRYATTWDTSPLARALQEHANAKDAARWLRRERGITHVLINYAELSRLGRSGFLDARLEPSRVDAFARSAGEPVRAWEERGQLLVRLRE